MRLSSLAILGLTFIAAAIVSLLVASYSVSVVEDMSEIGVRRALDDNQLEWAEVQADGLRVYLSGTAPAEAGRFKAISTAGTVVDTARIIDVMQVADTSGLRPPRFVVEILRNDGGVSLIGLVPADMDTDALVEVVRDIAANKPVSNLLQTADYPIPDGWPTALAFSLEALAALPRSKISVTAERVAVTATANTPDEKASVETLLARSIPDGVRLALDISAPRPVITPFTLRFVLDENSARFDACSADTEVARDRILAAAVEAGMTGQTTCTLGLGVPSPDWGQAVETAIQALAELGAGTISFSDADVTLIAVEGTLPGPFERIAGELEADLPDLYSLQAVLPETPEETDAGAPEFIVTYSPEGLVQIRGKVGSEIARQTADSYAQARFGTGQVYTAARVADDLPGDWQVRVLTALEALSYLSNGAVTVTPDTLTLSGNTGDENARATITRLLGEKLGPAQDYSINITYREELDPVAALPTPEECEAELIGIVGARKINFEPGSANVDPSASAILDDLADVLQECGDLRLEISGHTDSQGRESMNLALSQSRAQAVLTELRARRVLTSNFTAKGYGEEKPIADNGTEEGREANRRIEFRLILPEPVAERQTALEAMEDRPEPRVEEGQTANEQN